MSIAFTKMSGAGNDFVVIDNREGVVADGDKLDFVRKVCHRKNGVGADGVIFIENSDSVDFKWDFYNEDGSSAEMCGNGARCAARYAYERKIVDSPKMAFDTIAGVITGEIRGDQITVKLTKPEKMKRDLKIDLNGSTVHLDHVNTGVPHAVVFSEDVKEEDIPARGRGIRFHEAFAPAGTNVNFVQKLEGDSLKIRTYERGVEAETLACGTGVVASALVAAAQGKVNPPVQVETQGGDILKVHFQANGGDVEEVFLEGPATVTFEGTLPE